MFRSLMSCMLGLDNNPYCWAAKSTMNETGACSNRPRQQAMPCDDKRLPTPRDTLHLPTTWRWNMRFPWQLNTKRAASLMPIMLKRLDEGLSSLLELNGLK